MKEKIVEILADYKNVDASAIKTDVPFTELGLDSLDVAELVMQIEDELGVTLEMSVKYNTIDKLVERCGGYIVFTTNTEGQRVINWYDELGFGAQLERMFEACDGICVMNYSQWVCGEICMPSVFEKDAENQYLNYASFL